MVNGTAKEVCTRVFHTIQNSSFFQRIELPTPVRCVESCIDNIEYCKAALFISDEGKSKGLCQLYSENSQSNKVSIISNNRHSPTSTVFEILDKCSITNKVDTSSNNFLEDISLELKQKLESWSDQEFSSYPGIAMSSFSNEHLARRMPSGDDRKERQTLEEKNNFDILTRNEYNKWTKYAEVRRDTTSETSNNFNNVLFSRANNEALAQNVHGNKVSSEYAKFNLPISPQNRDVYSSNVPKYDDYTSTYFTDYTFPKNGVPLPDPIQPVSIIRGRQEFQYNKGCQGANCYAPSLAYLKQSSLGQPCMTYSSNPCISSRIHSCLSVSELLCPPVQTQSYYLPSKTTIPERFYNSQSSTNDFISTSGRQEFNLINPTSTPKQPSKEKKISSWSEWSLATSCSVTCGNGIRKLTRFCSASEQCLGGSVKEEPCNSGQCPQWGSWSSWSECSQDCGGGEQSRSRTCSINQQCVGPSKISQACNVEKCVEWSAWSDWETCSVTCGIGQQVRRRIFFGQCVSGSACIGKPLENKMCRQAACPSWSVWGEWSECNASCGGGQQVAHLTIFAIMSQVHRTRTCYSKTECLGDSEDYKPCGGHSCPKWTDWSTWTECSETCGRNGSKLRTRSCLKDNLISTDCKGAAQDQMACMDLPDCPSWTLWSSWSSCSVTCGHGQEIRQRSCFPVNAQCIGANQEFRFCQDSVCPYWNEWSAWSDCSVTCGIGTCERVRKCVINDDSDRSEKKEDNYYSLGALQSKVPIKSVKRAIISSHNINNLTFAHSIYGNVSTSRMYTGDRSNLVIRSARDVNSCDGDATQKKECDAGPCCKLSQWTEWTRCSASCGGGTRERHRTCSYQNELQSYELSRSNYYSEALLKAETPLKVSGDSNRIKYVGRSSNEKRNIWRPFATSLRPVVSAVHFTPIQRLRRQSRNLVELSSLEEDISIPSTDEYICGCNGKLHEKMKCAEISCPEQVATSTCMWSAWSEWCRCMGSCTQGVKLRSRYCIDGIPENGDVLADSYSRATTSRCYCYGSITDKESCTPQANYLLFDK
ncbi:unnamed protein product [Thelazia callipaeda]|uniref:Apple domain-containing protein n=1 Tax=Thelazia callipaeda TaxID=103827 RepID=A0A158RB75_THECL|nr:unnamed protein product [Thelazia callipaeda]